MATKREHHLNQYNELAPRYNSLAQNLTSAIRDFLIKNNIDFLDVASRIKTFDSFFDKIQRKKLSTLKPLEEIKDLCGIRIIVFYPSDLELIHDIIHKEFDVLETINKEELLEPDRFGYRSFHYIVKIKDEWLKAPNYRGLNDLVAEIQVRTILMHAWADLSHKLSYKEKAYIPNQFRRQMSRLSALFELADEQFDILRKEKQNYVKSLIQASNDARSFDREQPLDVDSLQAFMDYYFPDRASDMQNTESLLNDLKNNNITFRDLIDGYDKTKAELQSFEPLFFKKISAGKKTRWAQVGIVRMILNLSHDRYWSAIRRELENIKNEPEIRNTISIIESERVIICK